MWRRRFVLGGVFICLIQISGNLAAASPCDCLDIYDLVSRRSGVVAAITEFQQRWMSGRGTARHHQPRKTRVKSSGSACSKRSAES